MKKVLLLLTISAFSFAGGLNAESINTQLSNLSDPPVKKVKWYTWDEAVKLQMESPRIIMVDLFTDWCGWCKRMDADTFENDSVAQVLNTYFYPVKFNAEKEGEINYGGKVLKLRTDLGRNPIHELAYAFVDGKLSYPNFIYFDAQMQRIMISPGYKGPKDVMVELKYAAEGHYKNQSWNDYKAATSK